MKKTILSIAVLLASMAGITASAQSQNASPQAKTVCATGNCTKKDAPKYNPFQGLNLTEKQQAELQALKPAKGAKCTNGEKNASCSKNSQSCTKGNKDKQQLSQAEKQAQRKQFAEQRLQNRRDYLAKVKNILTPEQYVQFLENSYVDQGMKGPGHKHVAKGKDGKHHRQGKDQAMRGNRNGNKANAQGRKGNKPNCTNNGTCKQNPAQQNATADGSYYIDNGLIKVFPYQAQR
ncbi:Spy/CpxP family protein refolding chaperone [uncultured Duncaniella sp.]|uniref:Spy/CpxP family protein refolding chaperone n=1 Tax=uncultured Duncaniella sp. TaxID=2768039 RepID=UPI0025FA08AE|nr:Spy/CpxP family protein refolding chaperone [uncultured Duncaniella sp.]